MGVVDWIAAPGAGGLRTLCPRVQADRFESHLAASAAIDEMPRILGELGVSFSIEEM